MKKEEAVKFLDICKKELATKYPFIGTVAMMMDIIPIHDVRCDTACTDGENIYFDLMYMSTLTKEQIIFVIAHEVWHAALQHFKRQGGRDQEVWNIAADLEINQMLRAEGFHLPEGVCLPENFDDPTGKLNESNETLLRRRLISEMGLQPFKSAEEYSEAIKAFLERERAKKGKQQQNSWQGQNKEQGAGQPQPGGQGQGSGEADDKDGQGQGQDDGQEQSNSKASDKAGQGQGKEKQKSEYGGKGPNPNDELSPNKDYSGGESQQSAGKANGGISKNELPPKGFDPDFHPENIGKDTARKAEKMAEAMNKAANAAKKAGKMPGAIEKKLDKFKKADIDWRSELANHFQSTNTQQNTTYNKMDRRIGPEFFDRFGTIMPSEEGIELTIAVAVDTSGSTDEYLTQFLSEMNGIISMCAAQKITYKVLVIQCDVKIQEAIIYDSSLGDVFDVSEFKMKGGGGTHLRDIFDFINDLNMNGKRAQEILMKSNSEQKKENTQFDRVVVFSDGYNDEKLTKADVYGFDVLWVIHPDGTDSKVEESGRVVIMKRD
jgi:predicted metal-dependent peptidase